MPRSCSVRCRRQHAAERVAVGLGVREQQPGAAAGTGEPGGGLGHGGRGGVAASGQRAVGGGLELHREVACSGRSARASVAALHVLGERRLQRIDAVEAALAAEASDEADPHLATVQVAAEAEEVRLDGERGPVEGGLRADRDGGGQPLTIRLIDHVDAGGVHALGGHHAAVKVGGIEVEGGEADRPPPLLAADDPGDPLQRPAQAGRGVGHPALGGERADERAGHRDLLARGQRRVRPLQPHRLEARRRAQPLQQRVVAASAAAEAEVGALDDGKRPEPRDQRADERFRVLRQHLRRRRQHLHAVRPGFHQPVDAVTDRVDPQRLRFRPQQADRRRIEGDGDRLAAAAGGVRPPPALGDQRAVPGVNAVEVPKAEHRPDHGRSVRGGEHRPAAADCAAKPVRGPTVRGWAAHRVSITESEKAGRVSGSVASASAVSGFSGPCARRDRRRRAAPGPGARSHGRCGRWSAKRWSRRVR